MSSQNEGISAIELPVGRNIVVFSDGTGQAGGILVDEFRSNVYKLYRATRCGPDTSIDPDHQIAFYDPGLGSPLAGENIKFGPLRRIYNVLSSATGLGISHNITDCYAALIQLWRPGDRIFLFGFSRGAYTVRCLGGVLGLCGIPSKMPDGKPLRRDSATTRQIAKEAVSRVYSHGSGVDDHGQDAASGRRHRLGEQRKALGQQFREKYGSDEDGQSNAVPYFIGVWDTVAAVGISPPAAKIAAAVLAGVAILLAGLLAWWMAPMWTATFWQWLVGGLAGILLFGMGAYYGLRTKFVTELPGFPWYKTLHLTSFKMTFFDRSLNPRVRYARHALAIDEAREDFARVPWVNEGEFLGGEVNGDAWFKQIWFAGNHSDIGGSYPENESRLSDIALHWMAEEAQKAGLLIDPHYLRPSGRYTGHQHDECRVGIRIWGKSFKWREKVRTIKSDAPLHASVLSRLRAGGVLIYDEEKPYRPINLQEHQECRDTFAAAPSKTET
ncbi:DUF2235 domain-containing protein [Ancylobacter sp. FA202]|uniref:DUF2235 domain-containing protein n=1 Tax=Ancylobacter sp. FA202 TaxID=1111106 RepID=UPI00039EF2BF|nr:DUF2235 domain-containing protein [Ancylobacter sp. FA202]